MIADVVLLPCDLRPEHLRDRTVVVLDVLRATTTMAAALAAGVREIRVFDSLHAAASAAKSHQGPRVLCGERECLPPPGFDLGNSPGAFRADRHGDVVAFMSTTNGTRAIVAARGAAEVLIGALVNASATARHVRRVGRDATFVCAGTNGAIAMEDVIGAGAILDALGGSGPLELASDVARIAQKTFEASRDDIDAALRDAQGGRNVIAAGLGADIQFAAARDSVSVLGVVDRASLTVTRPIEGPID